VSWITLKTTSFRWEAELMQQILAAHQIPARIVDLGLGSSDLGAGSATALQVLAEDRPTAWLLIDPIEKETESDD